MVLFTKCLVICTTFTVLFMTFMTYTFFYNIFYISTFLLSCIFTFLLFNFSNFLPFYFCTFHISYFLLVYFSTLLLSTYLLLYFLLFYCLPPSSIIHHLTDCRALKLSLACLHQKFAQCTVYSVQFAVYTESVHCPLPSTRPSQDSSRTSSKRVCLSGAVCPADGWMTTPDWLTACMLKELIEQNTEPYWHC